MLVDERRIELGMSKRQLARAVTISLATVERIVTGQSVSNLTLDQIQRLAQTLACTAIELLADHADHLADEEGDHGVYAAMLLRSRRPVPLAALADVGAVTIDQLQAELRSLDHDLRVHGIRVRVYDGEASLVAAPERTNAYSDRVRNRASSRTRLTPTTARILLEAIAGPLPARRFELRAEARIQLGLLRRIGYLTATEQGDYVLHPDVAQSLLLAPVDE